MSRRSSPPRGRASQPNLLLKHASELQQAGRFKEASAIYEQIIVLDPLHFDAIHLLGVVALQEGRLDLAQQMIEKALRIDSGHASAQNNLGTVHLRKSNFDAAKDRFEKALKRDPASRGARINLGAVLRLLGRPREALVVLRQSRQDDPQSPLWNSLMGACSLDVGDAPAAVRYFEASTVLEPANADGWGNLAAALSRTGEMARARDCADKAAALAPDSSGARAAQAAIQFEQGHVGQAIAIYADAVASGSPSVQTLCGFANALWTSGRCDEGLVRLRQAVAVDPNSASAVWKLVMSHCQPFYANESEILVSRQAFSAGLLDLHHWIQAAHRPESYATVGSTQPFFIAYQNFNNRELLSRYGDVCCEWMSPFTDLGAPPSKISAEEKKAAPPAGRMRVGIASAHIRDHSVWNAVVKGWVQKLDKTRFELWLFHLGTTEDGETEWARRQSACFVDQPNNLEQWVRAIREAELDLVIYPEIGMDMLTTQLAALRLAPVQAAAWGHPETTGLPTMDLFISADCWEPPRGQDNYREQLVRLPNLGVYVEPLSPPEVEVDLVALGLPKGVPLLLCAGAPFKYLPANDVIWARIARGLALAGAGSGLGRFGKRLFGRKAGHLVFFRSSNELLDDLLAQRMRKAFDAERVDFDAHVSRIPHMDRSRFFSLMQSAALMLDTVGFSGFNTALQAVECGLPVLAREGPFMRGRLASGIMRRMGMDELVSTSDDAFIEAAISILADAPKLARLRHDIVERRHKVFHDMEPIHALERCLTAAIQSAQS